MGQFYNRGWSTADTNIVASIARRIYPRCPVDKDSLMLFVISVRQNEVTPAEWDIIKNLPLEQPPCVSDYI